MKVFERFKKLRMVQKVLIIITVLIVGIGGWIAYDNRPRPLGGEMVYLGKDGVSGLSYGDHGPYATYYYATDILPSDLPALFDAELKYPIRDNGHYTDISLVGSHGDFVFTYKKTSSFSTTKTYTLSILDSQYEIALKSLR